MTGPAPRACRERRARRKRRREAKRERQLKLQDTRAVTIALNKPDVFADPPHVFERLTADDPEP